MKSTDNTNIGFTSCAKCTEVSCFIDNYGDRHCYTCGWIDYKTNRNSLKIYESREQNNLLHTDIATDEDLINERKRYSGRVGVQEILRKTHPRQQLYYRNVLKSTRKDNKNVKTK